MLACELMATRNMIAANLSIFAFLDEYCLTRGTVIPNAGSDRYISSTVGVDRARLKTADLISQISFTSSLRIARFDVGTDAFFCTVGFDLPDEVGFAVSEDVEGGMATLILSELLPSSNADPLEISNIIGGGGQRGVPGYAGHDPDLILSLFPTLRCFSVEALSVDETYRNFFSFCLEDTRHSDLWMDSELRNTLALIAELSPVAIPYQTLCRSVFDTDPGNVFLALYRCLEALYAYSQTSKLIARLGVELSWTAMAQTLEQTLAWRPREEPSLEILLRNAVKEDLCSALTAIGAPLPAQADPVLYATKKIYALRNSLVHYRPFHHSFDGAAVDWNRLCRAMAGMVLDVYHFIDSNAEP